MEAVVGEVTSSVAVVGSVRAGGPGLLYLLIEDDGEPILLEDNTGGILLEESWLGGLVSGSDTAIAEVVG